MSRTKKNKIKPSALENFHQSEPGGGKHSRYYIMVFGGMWFLIKETPPLSNNVIFSRKTLTPAESLRAIFSICHLWKIRNMHLF